MPTNTLKTVFLMGPLYGVMAGWVLFMLVLIQVWLLEKLNPALFEKFKTGWEKFKYAEFLEALTIMLPSGMFIAYYDYFTLKPFTMTVLIFSVVGAIPFAFFVTAMSGNKTMTDQMFFGLMGGILFGVLLCSLYLIVSGS